MSSRDVNSIVSAFACFQDVGRSTLVDCDGKKLCSYVVHLHLLELVQLLSVVPRKLKSRWHLMFLQCQLPQSQEVLLWLFMEICR